MKPLSAFNRNGLAPYVEAALGGALPAIRGQYFGVDPYGVTDGRSPKEFGAADIATNLLDAYTACRDGVGDGIILFSGGSTAAHTTSYLQAPLAWSKYAITVYGNAAQVGIFGRARVANVERTTGSLTTIAFPSATTITDSASGFLTAGFKIGDVLRVNTTEGTNDGTGHIITAVVAGTITCAASTFTIQTAATAGATTVSSYNAQMITVSGENNRFLNMNLGNFSSDVLALGSLKVTANRNYFNNCHFVGAGHATPAADAGAYDLQLVASECVFDRCYFGTNTIIRAAANGNINLGLSTTQIGQNFFNGCRILSYSATAGKLAIKIADAATLGGWIQFDGCSFVNWNSGAVTALTVAIGGASPNNCGILISPSCSMVGWAAWHANEDKVFTAGPVGAAGTGGIAGSIA